MRKREREGERETERYICIDCQEMEKADAKVKATDGIRGQKPVYRGRRERARGERERRLATMFAGQNYMYCRSGQ